MRQRCLGLAAVLLLLLLLAVGSAVSAQSGGGYNLSWSTIDGGGTPSARAGATVWVARSARQMQARSPAAGTR